MKTKTSIFSILGGICISISFFFNLFKPFDLEKHNLIFQVFLLGMGAGFLVSHFISKQSTKS